MKIKLIFWTGIIFLLVIQGGVLFAGASEKELKKCLIVAAYHDEFEGQALKIKGISTVLEGKCEIRQFNMDTKQHPAPEYAKAKSLEAKALVESWLPDIIIAVDDNTSKYFVEPYFKNAAVPVVFCGLDWTADEYGYPYTNATGMIEVYPINTLVQQIKRILPDTKRAVCIRGNRLSEQKCCNRYKEVYETFGITVVDQPVHTFDEFKIAVIQAQQSDIIIFQNYSGIEDFDGIKAQQFILDHARALIVSQLSWMAGFSHLSIIQVIEEQGEYAATLALKILEGASPGQIPIIANRKWDVIANETLLEKSKIILPTDLLHKAQKIRMELPLSQAVSDKKKCFFAASYHQGYEWQDRLEKALRSVLEDKCDLLQFNMDTKRNSDPGFSRQKAQEAKALIESFKPDIVIAADDNASKYLIAPFYRNGSIPVVFCGLNWTADEYGYPYDNATGMIEVFPILPLVRHVRQILPQAKDGVILHTSHLSARKTVPRIQEAFKDAGILLSTATTDTMDGFESQYRTAQESDLIFLFNNSTLSDWDNNRAKQITTTLPSKLTVTMNKWMMPYTMLGLTGLPEEQGEYAAKAVLKILHGTAPRDIPIVSNRKWHTYVNKRLLQQAGIRLSDEILNQAEKMRP